MNAQLEREAQMAAAAIERGDLDGGIRMADAILKRHPDEPNALMVKALAALRRSDFAGAQPLLRRAVEAHPEHVYAWNNLGIVERRLGNLDAARQAFSEAIRIYPAFGAALRNCGNLLVDMGERNLAIDHFQAAHIAEPKSAEPLAALASIALSANKLEDARAFANLALERDPGHFNAGLMVARADLQSDAHAAAKTRLEEMARRPGLSGRNRALVHGLLGQALDAMGDHDAAYNAFEAANAALVPLAMSYAQGGHVIDTDHLTKLAKALDAPFPATARVQTDGLPPDPVFLVGFPRSGTTLLDQILASHPDIATLEEVDNLGHVTGKLLEGADVLARIAALTSADIDAMRKNYWERVRSNRRHDATRPVFIDKLPMNATLLAAVAAIFPQARVIFALRDPRDAVLSCFQQTFEMTGATIHFLSLSTAAQLYDATMQLMRVHENHLPIPVKRVRYEDVTARFDRTIADVLGFLGLAWSENVRNFTETARSRPIGTPSAPQVMRPLYSTSAGKWRNYAKPLRETRKLLDPWAEAFGYPVD